MPPAKALGTPPLGPVASRTVSRITSTGAEHFHGPAQLNWIANFIWSIADDVLRDVFNHGKYRDVILPMTVLRRLDAVLQPSKQAVLEMKAALDREKIDNQDDALRSASGQAHVNDLDEDGQVDFKGKAKAFTRTYDFLATILPYGVQEWEKLSIFLNFLIPKLPAPKEEDLAKGILEAIDMDSYRAEKKATLAIALPDADAEIEPVPTSGGGRKPEPEMDRLSNIVNEFNQRYAGDYADPERTLGRIRGEIPRKVSEDQAYKNAKQNSDRRNAKIEHDKALRRVITAMFKDDTQLFKQFQGNESFRHWLTDAVFGLTYPG